MRKTVLAILMALVALCASAVAEETAEDWVKKGEELLAEGPLEEVWNKTYGGPSFEMVHQVQETSDGGYIVVGQTESYGAGKMDAWLIKTDFDGNEKWNKTYGGFGDDKAFSVQLTMEGYIITGGTESYGGGNSDVWLIKTDYEGNEIWNKTFGGPGYEDGRSVLVTEDGGYIIAGGTDSHGAGNSDVWLIKTDPEGNEIWNKTIGGPGYDWGHSTQQTKDGGYIITGPTYSYDDTGEGDFWLIKTDQEGNEEWNRTFGGHGYDVCRSVKETRDGGYVIAGDTKSYGYSGSQDIWVVKTDASGNEQWNRTFGGTYFERGSSVLETEDGGYIIAGHTESYGYLPIAPGPTGRRPGNAWLIKTDPKGNEEWNKTFSGTQDISSVLETRDGGYIIAADTHPGDSFVGIWLVKIKLMPL